jgi:integrase
MLCIRKRRGKYVVDYRDAAGIRRWVTCATRKAAEATLAERFGDTRQPRRPAVDSEIRLADYAAQWMAMMAPTLKPRTREAYTYALARYLLPALGSVKVRQVSRGQIKRLLANKLQGGLSRGNMRIVYAPLRAMLNAAVEDGVFAATPAVRLGRALPLVPTPLARQERIKAMTLAQLNRLLATMLGPSATPHDRRLYPLLLCLARTGMRIGEALTLVLSKIDFTAHTIRVEASGTDTDTTKSSPGRTVDMSPELATALRRLEVERKAETLKRGWREVPPWVFCSEAGTPLAGPRASARACGRGPARLS